MRRPLMYLLVWVLGVAGVVTVSWWGISRALGAADPASVAPLSPVDLRDVVPSSALPTESLSPSVSVSTPESTPSTSETTPSATVSETWEQDSDESGGSGYKRTFHTSGGDAVVWSAKGDARILEATPTAGWDCSVRQDSVDSATVTFVAPGERNRMTYVSVGWLNGPIAEFGESVGLNE